MSKTTLQAITATDNGTLQVRLLKAGQGNHRTTIAPGGDVASHMAMVNDHLVRMGAAALDGEDIDKIAEAAKREHTAGRVTAYREKDIAEPEKAAAKPKPKAKKKPSAKGR